MIEGCSPHTVAGAVSASGPGFGSALSEFPFHPRPLGGHPGNLAPPICASFLSVVKTKCDIEAAGTDPEWRRPQVRAYKWCKAALSCLGNARGMDLSAGMARPAPRLRLAGLRCDDGFPKRDQPVSFWSPAPIWRRGQVYRALNSSDTRRK